MDAIFISRALLCKNLERAWEQVCLELPSRAGLFLRTYGSECHGELVEELSGMASKEALAPEFSLLQRDPKVFCKFT